MKCYLFALLIFFGACSNPVNESREAKIVKELMGKEIVFTNNLFLDVTKDDQSFSDVFQQKSAKIVTVISYDCGPCRESIKKWKEYMKGKSINFILIVRGGDEEFYNDIRSNESRSFRYIYYDRNNLFELANKIPQESRFRTLLINNENKIRIIGNPLFNKAIAKLYDEEIISTAAK